MAPGQWGMDAESAPLLVVEVVDTRVTPPRRIALRLPHGALLGDALAAAGLDVPPGSQDIGVFAQRRPVAWVLRDGDRVEIYRPLELDPKAARRRRAAAGR